MIPDENIKIVFFSSRMVQDCVYKYMYAQRMPQDCRILIPWLSVSCHGLVMHYILYWIVTLSMYVNSIRIWVRRMGQKSWEMQQNYSQTLQFWLFLLILKSVTTDTAPTL